MITRNDVDLNFVNRELHKRTPYTVIAYKVAEQLGVDPSQVSRSLIAGIDRDLKSGGLELHENQTVNEWVKTYRFGIDEDNGGVPVFVGHPRLDIDRAVVVSDPHFPMANFHEVERVNYAGEYYGATDLIVAGDMLDATSQSKHKRKIKVPSVSVGFDVAKQAIAYWLEQYERVWFEPGNHDDWLLENLEGELTLTMYARMLGLDSFDGRFVVTPYDRIHLFSSGTEWVIPHQAEASVNPLSVLEKLSWKYQANIIGPHQHKTATGTDRYGRYSLIAIGGLHEQSMLPYVNLKTSTRPVYNSGFVAVINGQYELVTPDSRVMGYDKF